jgi:23S rRNA A1618 N6-methylase RlmF
MSCSRTVLWLCGLVEDDQTIPKVDYNIQLLKVISKNCTTFRLHNTKTKKPQKAAFCCSARARTWTFLIQSQTCCQLHHGASL